MLAEPEFDANGYPTPRTLRRIKVWPISSTDDILLLLAFVRAAWRWPEWGWRVAKRWRSDRPTGRPTLRYAISTGGWSGNEDIIGALQGNVMFWALTWESSRRGGHYVFAVPRIGKAVDNPVDTPSAAT